MDDFWDHTPDLGLPGRDRRRKPRPAGGAVMFVRVKCPECGGTDVPVQHTDPPADGLKVRWHKCSRCGETFKSVEKVE